MGDTAFQAALSALDAAAGDAGSMDVIGHSFGAVTGLRLAVERPERVRSLTVIEPVLFSVAQRDAPEVISANADRSMAFRDAYEAGDMETAARSFNRMWSDTGPAWDSLPERTRAAMVRGIHVVPGTFAYLYDDDRGLLAPGALDAVQVPTLILRGEQASPPIVATNDGLARRMPNATQAVIADAGHMAPISHPEATADAFAAHLAASAVAR